MRIIMDVNKNDFPNGLSEEDKKDIRYLFADALMGFIRLRGPTSEEYIDKSYPVGYFSGYELERARKILQVDRRKKLANSLHGTVLSIRIEE